MAKAAAEQTLNHPTMPDKQQASRLPVVQTPAMSVEHLRVWDIDIYSLQDNP